MNSPHKETVLIVDDQEENIRVVGSVLSCMDYDIIGATSAEQALKRLNARTPDIILLDVMMPGTDGLTVCRRIKEDPRWVEIPIIFLSAADDKNIIVQALEAGGVDYVTKPFNRTELLSRVRTHLSLKLTRDHLNRLAEDKDEIIGILAHDLKNGIAGIKLSVGLLMDRIKDFPSRSAALVENIAETSDRLLTHMNGFLANQYAEQLELSSTPTDFLELMGKSILMNKTAAEAKKITIHTTAPDAPIFVMADQAALIQVFDNLLSNAIKFTPPGGQVEMIVNRPMIGSVECHICDSGPGFTKEDRGKLFRRYQRLSARPTANEPSTGLGLSIVKRLLLLMGGDIQLALNSGRHGGANFTVRLATPIP